jgi:6-phosphofructokinase 2
MSVPGIVTLTANPAIDVSASVDQVVPFHKLRCSGEKRDPGGGGINVARVLQRWKRDVTAIFPAGGTTGELLKRLVDREGIRRHAIEITGDTREDVTVFETRTGKQFRFVFPGPPLTEKEWQACCDALSSVIPRPGFVVTSGSLPPGAPADLYARVVKLSRRLGARPIVDTSGAALREALDEGVYLAKPNLRELSELAGRALTDEDEWLEASQRLVMTGRAQVLALTLGEQGALAVTPNGAWRAHAPPVQAVSTVGAGDSFLGAMILRIALGDEVAEALRYGVAAGSAALLAAGTELARPKDTEHLLAGVTIEKVR